MRVLAAIVAKDLRLLFRDKTGFFFSIVFPAIVAVGFGAMLGDGGAPEGVEIAVVDRDESERSRAFAERLEASPALDVVRLAEDEAGDRVRRGALAAYAALPAGFGEARERLFWGEPATVQLYVDPSREATAGVAEGVLSRYLYDDYQDLFTRPERARAAARDGREAVGDAPAALAEVFDALEAFLDALEDLPAPAEGDAREPARIDRNAVTGEAKAPPSGFAISFPQGMAWALMMSAMSFALGLVSERHQGTLLRLRAAPVSTRLLLAGKAASCLVLSVSALAGLSLLGAVAFGLDIASPVWLAAAVIAASMCTVGLMMLFAVLGRTEKAASGLASAAMVVLMMTGGGMLPLVAMPGWMESASALSPVRWAILAFEGSTWRALDGSEMAIPVAILVGIGLACFALGTWLFRVR